MAWVVLHRSLTNSPSAQVRLQGLHAGSKCKVAPATGGTANIPNAQGWQASLLLASKYIPAGQPPWVVCVVVAVVVGEVEAVVVGDDDVAVVVCVVVVAVVVVVGVVVADVVAVVVAVVVGVVVGVVVCDVLGVDDTGRQPWMTPVRRPWSAASRKPAAWLHAPSVCATGWPSHICRSHAL